MNFIPSYPQFSTTKDKFWKRWYNFFIMLASPKNKMVSSPAYQKIMHQYNERLQTDGKVNEKKFYEECVAPEIKGYSLQAWYKFLKRFRTDHGIIEAEPAIIPGVIHHDLTDHKVATTMLSNKDATAKAVQMALNISMDRLQQLLENPNLMTAKDAIDLLFKAMKAQDSRIHAIGKVKEDNREEEKMARAFSDSAYNDNE